MTAVENVRTEYFGHLAPNYADRSARLQLGAGGEIGSREAQLFAKCLNNTQGLDDHLVDVVDGAAF